MPEVATEQETIWKEALLLVLGAAVDHIVRCPGLDSGETDAFRKLAKESLQTLQHSTDPQQVLLAAGALSQAVTQYLNDTQRRIDALAVGERIVPGAKPVTNSLDVCTGLP